MPIGRSESIRADVEQIDASRLRGGDDVVTTQPGCVTAYFIMKCVVLKTEGCLTVVISETGSGTRAHDVREIEGQKKSLGRIG